MKVYKKILIILLIIIIVSIIISIFLLNNKTTIDYKTITLVYKVSYDYPYKIEYKILDNGEIMKSSILDELNKEGSPKSKYKIIGNVSKEDLKEIKNIIKIMNTENINKSDSSIDYGISIWNSSKNYLYNSMYYSQENVNKLNNIISKYLD